MKFELGEKVRVVNCPDNKFNNKVGIVDAILLSSDDIGIDFGEDIRFMFPKEKVEAVDDGLDDLRESARNHLAEIEAAEEEDNHSKLSDKEIALELVKAWGGQMGQPAEFDSFVDNYFKALNRLKEKKVG